MDADVFWFDYMECSNPSRKNSLMNEKESWDCAQKLASEMNSVCIQNKKMLSCIVIRQYFFMKQVAYVQRSTWDDIHFTVETKIKWLPRWKVLKDVHRQ